MASFDDVAADAAVSAAEAFDGGAYTGDGGAGGAMPTSLAAEADEPKGLLAPRPMPMIPPLRATAASAVNDCSRETDKDAIERDIGEQTNIQSRTETDRGKSQPAVGDSGS